MNQAIMNAMDAISGSQAVAYVTLGYGNRYCFTYCIILNPTDGKRYRGPDFRENRKRKQAQRLDRHLERDSLL